MGEDDSGIVSATGSFSMVTASFSCGNLNKRINNDKAATIGTPILRKYLLAPAFFVLFRYNATLHIRYTPKTAV